MHQPPASQSEFFQWNFGLIWFPDVVPEQLGNVSANVSAQRQELQVSSDDLKILE